MKFPLNSGIAASPHASPRAPAAGSVSAWARAGSWAGASWREWLWEVLCCAFPLDPHDPARPDRGESLLGDAAARRLRADSESSDDVDALRG